MQFNSLDPVPVLVHPNEDAVTVDLSLQGGDALHQMKTENRNLTQNLAVRAVHAVEVKRKSLEKEVQVLVLTESKSKRKKTIKEGKKQGDKLKKTGQGQRRRGSKSLAVPHLGQMTLTATLMMTMWNNSVASLTYSVVQLFQYL